jgi:hypothetical protein
MYIHAYLHIHIRTYIHTYIYIHTYTYIHTYVQVLPDGVGLIEWPSQALQQYLPAQYLEIELQAPNENDIIMSPRKATDTYNDSEIVGIKKSVIMEASETVPAKGNEDLAGDRETLDDQEDEFDEDDAGEFEIPAMDGMYIGIF